ncbi:uncharacterized protein [Atheta coriaria]|uniref:uncharacterized protein n=1 Tax=Dalotia coriaria TaxID=877792 RepID=UPI0031F3C6A6
MNKHVFIVFLCSFSELWAYKNYTVENPSVCSSVSKRTIKLGSGTDSSVLITQRRLSDHTIEWNKDYKCSFDIKSRGIISSLLDEPVGIFAVVQSMNLRRDAITHECIDYIQFKDSRGRTSLRLCGDLNAQYAMDGKFDSSDEDSDESDAPDLFGYHDEVSFLTFDDPYGLLTVYIYIDSKPLERGEHTDFTLAFTGYKHCRNSGYKSCDFDKSKCIYEAFFQDGVVNCPYYDCLDEGGCKMLKPIDVDKPLTIGSHILIGSATSLVVSFIVFVLCLYSCRKYGKFCWSEEFSRPPPNIRPPPAQTNAQVAPSVAETVNLHTPAVPSAPTPEDKDMPPSYESLFPPGATR